MGGTLSILNNIPSLLAENQLNINQSNLNNTLEQLSTGSRLNSGADDPAGLAIANGLQANIAALQQSGANANDGIGALQVADGALSQVTTLLDRAVTLATESANGTLSTTQRTSIDNEFTAIKAEIDSIGTATTYNGASVFTATATSIFMSDGSSTAANVTIATTTGLLSSAAIGTTGPVDLDSTDLTSAADATTALASITSAIANVASMRGTIGANMNRLTAAASVMQNEVTNYTSAESTISSADIGKAVSNLSQYQILQQTGMAALAQANSSQQAILKLLQ
jgi:flagellin